MVDMSTGIAPRERSISEKDFDWANGRVTPILRPASGPGLYQFSFSESRTVLLTTKRAGGFTFSLRASSAILSSVPVTTFCKGVHPLSMSADGVSGEKPPAMISCVIVSIFPAPINTTMASTPSASLRHLTGSLAFSRAPCPVAIPIQDI